MTPEQSKHFIDAALARRLNIPTELLPHRLKVTALNGQRLPDVTHITEPISLTPSGNHSKTLRLFVFKAPLTPLVLGFPWLQQHNPTLDWKTAKVSGWGEGCHMTCLKAAISPISSSDPGSAPDSPDLSSIPPIYHDLLEVFSKDRASLLPPHRPYDCGIDLLPGTPLPTSRLYSISQPEREALERYIFLSSYGWVFLCRKER